MGNLVIHGGSVQNTIPATSERYIIASMSTSSNAWADVLNGKAEVHENYSVNYVSSPNYNMAYLINTISNYYVDITYYYPNEDNKPIKKSILGGTYETGGDIPKLIDESTGVFLNESHNIIITFYLLKNNVGRQYISGINYLLTQFTKGYGISGKISSKSTYFLNNNGSTVASNIINLFTNTESENPGQQGLKVYGVSKFGEESFTNILNGEGFLYFNQHPDSVKIMKFNRFGKRKLSGFNVCFKGTSAFDNSNQSVSTVTYNKSKLLCTFLCQYDFNNDQITILLATSPDKSEGGYDMSSINKGDGFTGYFHVYIFESNIETTSSPYRSVAIEFLSVDAIQIPASFGKQDVSDGSYTEVGNILLVSKNKIIPIPISGDNNYSRGKDPKNNALTVGIAAVTPLKGYNLKDNKLDVLRIYDDKTCDVYEEAVSIEYSKYRTNSSNQKVYYAKLNK